jgi:hypothetical protein
VSFRNFAVGLAVTILCGAGSARSASLITADILNGTPCANNAAAKCFQPGDDIQAQVRFSFPDVNSFGGGFDITFDDTLASLDSFTLDSRWGFDPQNPTTSFSRPLGFFSQDPHLVAVGELTPFGGDGAIGTLVLRANAAGEGSITLAPGSDSPTQNPAGPFIDQNGKTMAISFQGADFSIVPEPGSLLLVILGLAGFAVSRGRA